MLLLLFVMLLCRVIDRRFSRALRRRIFQHQIGFILSLLRNRLWKLSVNVLQSWGPFMVVPPVSRCLHVRGSCRVALSVLFDPPVTSRASLVQISWCLVAVSGVMWSTVFPVWIVLISALVSSEDIMSTAVVSPCHHLRQKKKELHGYSSDRCVQSCLMCFYNCWWFMFIIIYEVVRSYSGNLRTKT